MSRYAIKFPFRVRIHGGEFDESARAIHREDGLKTIQAESGIVLESTIERKQMSTKTTFKRIALVTVAALGFGVMSVAPSSAAGNLILWCDIADGVTSSTNSSNSATTNAACNGVAGTFNYVTLEYAGVQTADAITVKGSKIIKADGTIAADGTMFYTADSADSDLRIATTAVGTITVEYYKITAGAGVLTETVTITVNAAKLAGVANAANSKSYLVAGDSGTAITDVVAAADATVSVAATLSQTPVATIKMLIKDGLLAAVNDSVTATISSPTGAGTIGSRAIQGSGVSGLTSIPGTISADSAAADAAGAHNFYVFSNGVAGVATITLKIGTTVIATETVSFTGKAATYAVALASDTTTTGKNIAVGGTAVYNVTAKDSAGNLVAPEAVYAFSGTAATATVTTSANTATGVAAITVTGVAAGTSEITFGNASTAALSTVTAKSSVEVTLSKAKTVAMAFDKDSYEPGEKMVLTVTATDANGKGVADGTRALFAADLVSNFTLSGTANLANTVVGSPVLLGGKKVYTIYAPATPGKLTVTATEGADTDSTTKATLTASATVTNVALVAAQEATDAANEATDAGNNAKDAADQAIEAADAATIAAQDAAAAAEAAGEMAVEAAEAAGAIAQDALDAANAATDAALSAAEAADAATAAATEAKESADAATAAVAELSAEVAKLMAALTTKVTTLSNLVAKIAKKVKA
jgi:hypothetical protein